MNRKTKRMPSLRNDKQAEDFVAKADLTEYDLKEFVPMRYEIAPKTAQLNMRLPRPLLDASKARAAAQGVPYARYVRQLLEADVARSR